MGAAFAGLVVTCFTARAASIPRGRQSGAVLTLPGVRIPLQSMQQVVPIVTAEPRPAVF